MISSNEAASPVLDRHSASKLLIGTLLFLFLYNIQFSFLPLITSRVVLLFGFGYLLWSVVKGWRMTMTRDIVIVTGLCILSFLYALANFFFHGFSDSSLSKGTALLLLHSGAGGLLFTVLFVRAGLDFRGVVRMFQAVIALQAFFIVLYFISMAFREFNLSVIVTHSNLDPFTTWHRARGIAGSFGASLALVQSFGLLFTAYLFSLPGKSKGEVAYHLACFMMIVASVMLTGRTGFLMLPVVAGYFLLNGLKDPASLKRTGLFLLFIPVAIFLGYLILMYGSTVFPGNEAYAIGGDRFNQLMGWIKSEVSVSSGGLESTTLNILKGQWFFPQDARMVLIGDPATWEVHRIRSDIGWIRLLFGGGIIGSVLFYGAYVAMFLSLYQGSAEYRQKILIALLFAFLLLGEFKEPFLMKVDVNSYLFILFLYAQLSKTGMLRRKVA